MLVMTTVAPELALPSSQVDDQRTDCARSLSHPESLSGFEPVADWLCLVFSDGPAFTPKANKLLIDHSFSNNISPLRAISKVSNVSGSK